MQTIPPLPIDNTPALNDLRRAAAKIGTRGSEEEHGAEPIEKRALAAIIERAFSDEPARGLTYPEEIEHLTDWLAMLAVKRPDGCLGRDERLLALIASYMSGDCEESTWLGKSAIELVRAVAIYFLRNESEWVARCMLEDERSGRP